MRSLVALGAAVLAVGTSARAATLDFETAGQFSNNFRKISGPGTGTQTGPTAGNDYVSLTAPSNFVAVYDTTPADGTVKNVFSVAPGSPVSLTADLTFTGSSSPSSSFGVYFVDPTNEGNGYLALLNYDSTGAGTSELVRLATGVNPQTNGAAGLVAGSPSLGNVITSGVPATATFTYAIDASNHPVLSVTVGSVTSSATFDTITSPLTSVELAIRNSAQGTTGSGFENDFDNVVLPDAAVPEPTSLAAIGLGVGGLVSRRRRRRRA
jgi:hypothetical protein